MATEFNCDYCNAALDKNATLVHTERYQGQWYKVYSICPDCFKHFKVMLEKAKSQKSWTGWTSLEQEVASLKKENESLKLELQFLRQNDPTCEQFMTADPHNELLTVASKGGKTMMAHRSILISRSAVFKKFLTSEDFKRQQRRYPHEPIKLPCVPTHADSFGAFIQFLYTAEVKPEILKDHAPELMEAGNENAIEILTRKCEDYMVNNMTPENTINYLTMGEQCNSTKIIAAALKQIRSNSKTFVDSEGFQALKNNPAACFGALQQIILDPTSGSSGKKKEKKLKGSDPGSVPGPDPSINSGLPRDHRYETSYTLGMCTCSVHPFAHSAAPGYEYHGVQFHAATAMPSTGYYVDPASGLDK